MIKHCNNWWLEFKFLMILYMVRFLHNETGWAFILFYFFIFSGNPCQVMVEIIQPLISFQCWCDFPTKNYLKVTFNRYSLTDWKQWKRCYFHSALKSWLIILIINGIIMIRNYYPKYGLCQSHLNFVHGTFFKVWVRQSKLS